MIMGTHGIIPGGGGKGVTSVIMGTHVIIRGGGRGVLQWGGGGGGGYFSDYGYPWYNPGGGGGEGGYFSDYGYPCYNPWGGGGGRGTHVIITSVIMGTHGIIQGGGLLQ